MIGSRVCSLINLIDLLISCEKPIKLLLRESVEKKLMKKMVLRKKSIAEFVETRLGQYSHKVFIHKY